MRVRNLLVLLFVRSVFGASLAPEDLTGSIFYEVESDRAPGIAGAGLSESSVLLNPNGRFVGLWSRVQRSITLIDSTSIPASGSWSYQRIDDSTGELTLNGSKKRLNFTSLNGGSIPGTTVFSLGHGFTLTRHDESSPLTNCSNRSFVRAGESAFTGFVITSASRGRVLVRAVGPGLQDFGLSNTLGTPVLRVVKASDNSVVGRGVESPSVDAVIVEASRAVGAFPLARGSSDSAVVLSLAPGAYIAEVSSSDLTDSGQVLIEVYMLP